MCRRILSSLALALLLPIVGSAQAVCSITAESQTGCSATSLSETATSACVCDDSADPFGGHGTLTNGLVSAWPLNETSGTREDAHGSNDLTDNNTVGFTAGKRDNAAIFIRANSEYLSVADNVDVSTGDIDYTFAAWVKLTSKTNRMSIIGKDAAGNREYELYYQSFSDRFEFTVFDGISTTVGLIQANNLGSPAADTWYFIVAWHDAASNQVGIQVNNGTPDLLATTGAAGQGGAEFDLGRRSYVGNEDYLDGVMDEVLFWKRALSSQERSDLWNGGAGRFY